MARSHYSPHPSVANLVCRVGVVLEDGTASAHGRVIAQCGLEILSVCVELQTSSSQSKTLCRS